MDKPNALSQARTKSNPTLRARAADLAWALIAFLLGQATLPFGTQPLGIALLCAARQRTGWMLLGLCTSVFAAGSPDSAGGWMHLAVYPLIIGIRILVRLTLDVPAREESVPFAERVRALARPAGRAPLFGESLMLRMATACAAAFAVSIVPLFAGGFRYYDLFSAFFCMVAAPLICLLYAPFFSPGEQPALLREAAVGGLLISLCCAVREVELLGISAGVFLAFVLTMTVTRQCGVGRGMLLGFGCGLCITPLYAPLFCIAAGAAGLLWPRTPTAAVTVAALLGMIWGGYTDGLTALIRLVPALVCGSIFVLSAERLGLYPPAAAVHTVAAGTSAADPAAAAISAQRAESAEARIRALSDTFSALSQICSNLSDRLRRPGVIELRRICDEACDSHCRTCVNRELCWEEEYGSTVDVLGKLTIELHGSGKASTAAVPDYLLQRCPSIEAILADINRAAADLWAETLRGDRTEVFAVDYAAISAILSETLAAEQADYAIDDELTARVRKCAADLRLGSRGILAYGTRRKQIIANGLDLRRAGLGVEDIRRAFGSCCGFALSTPVFSVRDDLLSMRLSAAPRYTAEAVRFAASADGSETCGDSLLTFENNRADCFYALISDGMGSGREAALTARICTVFLEKMLTAGNRRETALRLLNTFVRAKGIECSATIDLMELDLISGRASFIKSGAAPSYVRRGGNLFKLQSKTVPIGIMRALDAEQLCFDVEPGDVIVMLSDGIAQGFEESVWLLDMLSCSWDEGEDLHTVAEKILAEAARRNPRPDDRSVALIRISEAGNALSA